MIHKPIIAIAPMMDWTDRHCRYFLRQISQQVVLYTEMITAQAILYGACEHLLAYHPKEHPLVIQLGGSCPDLLSRAARVAASYGYAEINLNVGCPSDRVKQGKFGACLMAEPLLVADCIAAMKAVVNIPVTVKTRIGIDSFDSYEYFQGFIDTVSTAGCTKFIIHARKAWLQGLSPKENREIPPLQYDYVYRLKQHFPHLTVILNGGVTDQVEMREHLAKVDGVMLGRAAYYHPYLLANIGKEFFGDESPIPTRRDIVYSMIPYLREMRRIGVPIHHVTRHMLGLFHSVPGGKCWRRYLSQHVHLPSASENILLEALEVLDETITITNI